MLTARQVLALSDTGWLLPPTAAQLKAARPPIGSVSCLSPKKDGTQLDKRAEERRKELAPRMVTAYKP